MQSILKFEYHCSLTNDKPLVQFQLKSMYLQFQEPSSDEMEIPVTVTKNGPFYINDTFDPDDNIPDTGGGKGEIVRISNGKIATDMEDGTRL